MDLSAAESASAPPPAAPVGGDTASASGSAARAWLWTLGALALLSLRAVWFWSPTAILDDAFISFRYAANLAAGHGLVFNPGEIVEGYTNFLWVVLLAGCRALRLDLPQSSLVLALLASLATVALLTALARRLLPAGTAAPLVALPAFVYAALAATTHFVLSGMETSLFVLLLTLGLYLLLRGDRPGAAGAVFAMAAMTRPEGVMYFGLAAAAAALWLRPASAGRGAALARQAGGFLALFAPYFLWRFAYYGYPLPNTFYAKETGLGESLVARGAGELRTVVFDDRLDVPLLLAFAAAPAIWRDGRWRLLAAFAAAAFLSFVLVGGDFLLFFGPRFLMPAIPALALLDAAALEQLLTKNPPWRLRRGLLVAALAGALLLSNAWLSWPAHFATLRNVAQLNRSWQAIGTWLRANAPADAWVAVGAAGRIPYYSGLRSIDTLGLTDLHIAHLSVTAGNGIPGHEKADPAYVLSRHPDFIVFARLDTRGKPLLGGWDRVASQLAADYQIVALAKSSEAPGPPILATARYTPELGRRGYRAAIVRRRATPPPQPPRGERAP